MGASGAGSSVDYTPTYTAETSVTPAVARSVEGDTATAASAQSDRRQRLRGIRSTYSRFASGNGGAQTNGSATKLG